MGLRTSDYLYVEYADGFVELYDLKADPYEMENVASQTDAALLSRLSQWLHELAVCAGSECVSLDKRVIK